MCGRTLGAIWIGFGVLFLVLLLPDRVVVWMDGRGHTYLSDEDRPPAPDARRLLPEEIELSWGGRVTGPPLESPRQSFQARDRYDRELLAAREDIVSGELDRGLASLRRLHREHPGRPEAAVLLAQVERRRGRLRPAREALDAALSVAAEMPEVWRRAAVQLSREIDEEIAFAQAQGRHGETRVVDADHFRIVYDDHDFAGRRYGERVLELLEHARRRAELSVGRTLQRPLEIRLYTRARYLERYRHRFGFATVGFYDGAIHVVAARHPRRELLALVVHEYLHAIFEEALGGHRPFFLNEGIADREEERARGRRLLSRGEWRRLLDALREDRWVSLASLIDGFAGVRGRRALLAYLESRAAVELIEDSKPGAIAEWLDRCAAGSPWELALQSVTGWDTTALEQALQEAVSSRFPRDPLAEAHMR
ncbi:MAG: hypothetical protein ACE5FG_09465 [Myxococcota bacterium]